MEIEFRAIREPEPGPKWAGMLERFLPGYKRWFLKEGDAARPGYAECARALRRHMPELIPTWERLVDLAGGGDIAARLLSLYRPAPYLSGCSQAVWTKGKPLLVRNYDYAPHLWEGVVLHTTWNGRRVIGMSDCLWGLLDGINEAGLTVSLSFGGSRRIGDGFGIPLVLRYILEFCETTKEAADRLSRIPCHMAYNITMVDASGDYLTIFLAPGEPAHILKRPFATNHQHVIDWRQYVEGVASLDRERLLVHFLDRPHQDSTRFVSRFLQPPLYFPLHSRGWGTLYTAVYNPVRREAAYQWPSHTLRMSFDDFAEMNVRLIFHPIKD